MPDAARPRPSRQLFTAAAIVAALGVGGAWPVVAEAERRISNFATHDRHTTQRRESAHHNTPFNTTIRRDRTGDNDHYGRRANRKDHNGQVRGDRRGYGIRGAYGYGQRGQDRRRAEHGGRSYRYRGRGDAGFSAHSNAGRGRTQGQYAYPGKPATLSTPPPLRRYAPRY